MPKRVHELAKELNLPTKELINIMVKQNIQDKKTMSSLSDDEVVAVKSFFTKPQEGKEKSTEPKQQSQQTERTGGNNYQGNRQQGDRNRQEGDRSNYQGNRQQGDRSNYQNNRPQGQGNYQNNRQQGDRPQGQGSQGSYQGNRQQGDRPQGQGGQGSYQGNRQQGDRPNYQNNRLQGQGGQGSYQGNRQQGDRPNYQNNRPQGQGGYQGNRQQGDRNRQQGDRPQGQGGYQGNLQQGQGGYQGNRQQGDRPNYQNNRPQGQGGYQGNRQQGDRPQGQGGYQGNRQQGDRPQGQGGYQGNRQQGDRPQVQGTNRTQSGSSSSRQNSSSSISSGSKPMANRRGTNKPTRPGDNQYGKRKRPMDGELTATQKKKEKRKAAKKEAERLELEAIEAAKLAENDIKTIQVGSSIAVGELASKLKLPIQDIIMPLMKIGIMASINHEIDFYTAAKIAEEHDILVEALEEVDILEEAFGTEKDSDQDLKPRPPVVVVMGHVDHGKTSLLDAIRSSAVADVEAGGITQRIGAYQVDVNERKVTFLDTPGHEAFTAMRMRGAQVTDIAILVVAADDGVMPQTIEAINHAKAAGVEIIVAINKIDKPQSNPDRVKQELSEYGIVPIDWGGNIECVPVSAKQRTGVEDLLETVLLVAELKELKANPDKRAMGTVIEANLDKGKGPVATVLIQEGTLSIQDPIVVGEAHGRIRAMMNHRGERVKIAGPSTPVEIIGLGTVPKAGDTLYVAESERQAGQVAASMVAKTREEMIKQTQKISLDDLFNQIQAGNVKDLNIVIKADVQGSVEALRNSLERLSNEEVRIRIIHGGVGQITESDITLSSASNAIIIGFNVIASPVATQLASSEQVDIRLYKIIYNAIEDITTAMKGMLDPIYEEKIIGHAEIRQLFTASGTTIAGSYVTDGKIQRNAKARVLRKGKVIHEGEIGALKRFKDDVKEVATNYECGISFAKFNDLVLEDVIEAYIMEEVPR